MVEGISPVSSIIDIPSNYQIMSSEAVNNEPQSDNMEQVEDKVNVEEATINLDYVKRELEEGKFEFDENCYKLALTFGNIFGQSSSELRDNRDTLIGFLDDEVIMETGTIKLEDVKEEEDLIRNIMERTDCNKCGGNYEGYCPECSSLSHILNNLTPNIKPEPILNTAPINMLEIRDVSTRRAVFALKTFPKGIIVGPFEGITPVESTTGLQWKITDNKLANDQNGNWMKYIESVGKDASKNLDVFQFDGVLYFETSRDVQEGEELLVCYREEKDSDNAEEFYLTPVKKEKYPRVFACTLCCLGFRLEKCLIEHKSKCTRGDHGDSSEGFQIVQCRCCKVWLEKHEHLENHMLHCRENYNRLCRNRKLRDFPPIDTEDEEEKDEITTSIDVDARYSTHHREIIDSNNCFIRTDFNVHKEEYFHDENSGTIHSNTNGKTHKCSESSYQTNLKGHLKTYFDTHTGINHFQCDVCKQRFGQKDHLKVHLKNKHSNINEKEYKCFECSYQTNRKGDLKIHLVVHTDVKNFQCDNCKKRYRTKAGLKVHLRSQHSNTSEMEYKCPECSYQTNFKSNLNVHLVSHTGIMQFECDTCKKTFRNKSNLKMHIKNKHSNPNEKKEYKCSECSYETNYKSSLKIHLVSHTDVKNFECDICKQRFGRKSSFKLHIKYKHSNTNEKKKYKCSECFYQTNFIGNFKSHLNIHTDIKPFECDICKNGFTQKSHLQRHIKNKHLNINEKKYKCSECFYEPKDKGYLKVGLVSHTNVKDFQCDICKQRFDQKSSMKVQINNQHSNATEKEYKCSKCSYQTIYKSNLNVHLITHSDVKNFHCDHCKKRYGTKGSLKVHLRSQHSNTSEMKYKCPECSYHTNFKSNLNVHFVSHTGIKHFECDTCKKTFGYKSNMKEHIKNKHSNPNEKKEYKCSECSYETNYKSSLKIHLDTHTKDLQCDICKQRFGHKRSLKNHIKNKH